MNYVTERTNYNRVEEIKEEEDELNYREGKLQQSRRNKRRGE